MEKILNHVLLSFSMLFVYHIKKMCRSASNYEAKSAFCAHDFDHSYRISRPIPIRFISKERKFYYYHFDTKHLDLSLTNNWLMTPFMKK